MKRLLTSTLTLACALLTAQARPETTIDAAASFAWGENIGWINVEGHSSARVVVAPTYLAGFAWAENVGWINLGERPDNGSSYTQSAGDTGVNRDGSGNLSGFAWGENIGWLVFDTTGAGGSRISIDGTGQLHGFAWSENVGWVSFNSGHGVRVLADRDPSGWMMF